MIRFRRLDRWRIRRYIKGGDLLSAQRLILRRVG